MNGNYYESSDLSTSNSIFNILKDNIGKKVRIKLTIPNNESEYSGIIEKVGNDYLIISNPENGEWQMFLPIYLAFITFEERINY